MSERSVAKMCAINFSRLLPSLTLAVGGILADGTVVAHYPKTSGSRLSEICGILCLNFSEADS